MITHDLLEFDLGDAQDLPDGHRNLWLPTIELVAGGFEFNSQCRQTTKQRAFGQKGFNLSPVMIFEPVERDTCSDRLASVLGRRGGFDLFDI
ncbi:MAG: hypothetical protein CM1200mP2_28920 [Planctomycetaceae bacterium]|nr:MAG: hypothetical protein CM1200mP2_28920 [Planctomycetaceae bacterium]